MGNGRFNKVVRPARHRCFNLLENGRFPFLFGVEVMRWWGGNGRLAVGRQLFVRQGNLLAGQADKFRVFMH